MKASVEFKRDGHFIMWIDSPLERTGPYGVRGTYRLAGNTLLRTRDSGEEMTPLKIEVLTEERYVNSGLVGTEVHVTEYVRMRTK